MKKLFSVLLVIALLLPLGVLATSGLDIDLTTLTLDELFDLHKKVDAEIEERMACISSTISKGAYIVGESIKANHYLLTNADNSTTLIMVFGSKENYQKYRLSQMGAYEATTVREYVSRGETLTVQLKDGMVLLIDDPLHIQMIATEWIP